MKDEDQAILIGNRQSAIPPDLCHLRYIHGGCTFGTLSLAATIGHSFTTVFFADMPSTRSSRSRGGRALGWMPDTPDHRDLIYAAAPRLLRALPTSVDLTSKMPAVYDQGQIGSCTANAIAAAVQFDRMRQGNEAFMPSRLFVYYNERAMEHTVNSDAGAMIRDGIKSVAKQGDCRETTWTYAKGNLFKKPPQKAYTEALKYQALQYQRVARTLEQMRGCLAEGFPWVFGITVYDSFMSSAVAKSGVVPMPTKKEKVQGGHAMVIVGYNDAQKRFLFRNSWGTTWGKKGYGTIPYGYLTDGNLSDDFWTIRVVE